MYSETSGAIWFQPIGSPGFLWAKYLSFSPFHETESFGSYRMVERRGKAEPIRQA
jgi:hypothetical protein